ncbi:hypothetical protein XpopCFBP1817_15730 [Xanthomonas populi]|uniref:histidine kinase n=1 Tax=Xanthomonas populi TaxID=53414 RepID=A0A2S7ELB5_9XANT|nr:hypothetical protein XpopCFBP1817_15730 [Xanthomonas populi]
MHGLAAAQTAMICVAGHALRTPMAILTTRLSALPASALKTRLLQDAVRLSAVTGQWFDIQRLGVRNHRVFAHESGKHRRARDTRPGTAGSGCRLPGGCRNDAHSVPLDGDQVSIERALTNLIQNAIRYGGRQGTITIRASAITLVEVADEGRGVKDSERERIFEAFHRDSKHGRRVGAGPGADHHASPRQQRDAGARHRARRLFPACDTGLCTTAAHCMQSITCVCDHSHVCSQ